MATEQEAMRKAIMNTVIGVVRCCDGTGGIGRDDDRGDESGWVSVDQGSRC